MIILGLFVTATSSLKGTSIYQHIES